MDTTRERRRHYDRRTPENELALTQRDIAILFELYANRFMNTRQLQALFGERVFRRLHLLFHHGYVDRPKAARIWRMREGGGSKPSIYALANRGARVLEAMRLIEPSSRDFSERNRELADFSLMIPHELAVSDVRVAFRRACQRADNLHLLGSHELASGQSARSLDMPDGERPLIPDWIFAISRDGSRENASLFFVEVDRVTEPNVRHTSTKLPYLKGKFESYLTYARARQHLSQFAIGNFRVLTVTEGGPAKVENVAKTAGDVGGGNGRFLVTNFDALSRFGALDAPWRNSAGETVRLTL